MSDKLLNNRRKSNDQPHAHHTTSSVENDPLMLPNGRVYGRDRLVELMSKDQRVKQAALSKRDPKKIDRPVVDPVTGSRYSWDDLKKVYIT